MDFIDLSYFAGLTTIVWRYATWFGLFAGVSAIAMYFPFLRKWAIGLMAILIAVVIAFTVGVNDGTKRADARNAAKQERLDTHVETTITDAIRRSNDDGVRDPFDSDKY